MKVQKLLLAEATHLLENVRFLPIYMYVYIWFVILGNWSPEPPGSELKPNLTSVSGETTLELNWTRIYKNAAEYTYLGSELFYAEVNFTGINASTTTCPPSLQDILIRSEMDFQFQRRLVLFGNESKQTLKGLNSDRHYAVYV